MASVQLDAGSVHDVEGRPRSVLSADPELGHLEAIRHVVGRVTHGALSGAQVELVLRRGGYGPTAFISVNRVALASPFPRQN